MQKIIRSFVADFRKNIEKSPYRREIVSAVIFGSAARGGFVKGYSDVDVIIVTKDGQKRDEIQEYMRTLISKLNRKHHLLLEESCSDERKFKNHVLNSLLHVESFFLWGVPVYVLPQNEFDLVKKKVTTPKLWILVTFIGTLSEFLEGLKDTAVTVYGENLLKEIKDVRLSLADKIKLTLEPYYLLLLATIIAPFDAKFALKHAIKASVLESEFDLIWLHEKLGSYQHDEKLYDSLFRGHEFEVRHLRRTMEMRSHMHSTSVRKAQAWNYILDSYRFVASSHAALLSK